MFAGSIFLNLQKVLLCMAPYLQHHMGVPNENGSAIESIDNAVMRKRASANEEIQANCIFFQCCYTEKRPQPWKNLQLFVNQYLSELII